MREKSFLLKILHVRYVSGQQWCILLPGNMLYAGTLSQTLAKAHLIAVSKVPASLAFLILPVNAKLQSLSQKVMTTWELQGSPDLFMYQHHMVGSVILSLLDCGYYSCCLQRVVTLSAAV